MVRAAHKRGRTSPMDGGAIRALTCSTEGVPHTLHEAAGRGALSLVATRGRSGWLLGRPGWAPGGESTAVPCARAWGAASTEVA
jgi:hypothetical protein